MILMIGVWILLLGDRRRMVVVLVIFCFFYNDLILEGFVWLVKDLIVWGKDLCVVLMVILIVFIVVI